MAVDTPPSLTLSRAARREFKIPRLIQAMRKSSLVMFPYRVNRKKMIAHDAANEWSDKAYDLRRPWNGIGLFRRVILQTLINTTPRCLLSTWNRDHKIPVKSAQDWANRQFDRINLADQLRRWFDDALHLMGIMKVGITTPLDAERAGWRTFAGEAFAATVDFDDYICDVQARNLDELSFEMHRYRASAEMANTMFKLRGSDKLSGETPQSFNNDGDERIGFLGKGFEGGEYDEFGEMTDLWEVYLPGHRKLLTFRCHGGKLPSSSDDLLETREYVGPDGGPFVKLAYLWVPGNLFPRGPIMDLFPLDETINQQLRKVLRQAERFKQIDIYSGAATKDMERIRDASDGEPIKVDKLNEIKQWMSGPPNAALFGVTQAIMQIFNKLAGNMDTLGGLARQAGTAAQESQLNQNAGGFVGMLQRASTAGTSKVMSNLLWYYWNDPQGVMETEYKLDTNPNVGINRQIHPAGATDENGQPQEHRRDLPWEDLDVKVDPYSLTADTPQSKLANLRGIVQTLTPMQQFLAPQGIAIDYKFWLSKEAEYANNPDIAELVHLFDDQGASEQPGAQHDATKSPVTSRTVTRKNESEQTDAGQSKDFMQQLMGAQGQNGEQSTEGYQ